MKRKTFVGDLIKYAELFNDEKINNFVAAFAGLKSNTTKEKKKKPAKMVLPKTKEQYAEYLKGELWSKIRKKVLDKKGKRCEACGSINNIHVHHTTYSKKILRGESLSGLKVLCKSCHFLIHDIKITYKKTLKQATAMVINKGTAQNLQVELEQLRSINKNRI